MANKRCIPVKKELIKFMSIHFPDFLFQGCNGPLYAFCQKNDDGIYDYILIQREYYEETISLCISEIASCYNRNWQGVPWFTVGYGTDIAVLITGKNCYDAHVGWHKGKNDKEDLNKLFYAIKSDIDTYVLTFISKCHEKINSDKHMVETNMYMQSQFSLLNEEEVHSIKNYLVEVNKAYQEYRKECKIKKQKETIDYFDIIPLHSHVEKWVTEIQKILGYSKLSRNLRIRLIKDTTVLFRDTYGFYNL